MEAEHSETIVDKAVAYVKDMLGMPPADRPPDVVANPEYTDTAPELTSEDAMRLDPHAYAFNKIVERSRRIDEQEKTGHSAVDEHEQAAEKLDRAEGSAQFALNEIQDISRGMKEDDELPSESEMQDAMERARATHTQEKNRQAQQQSAGW
jgi:hypothetical protein